MMYNIQKYWVFGLLFNVRYSRDLKTQCWGNWICFLPQMRRGRHLLCKGPNTIAGVSVEIQTGHIPNASQTSFHLIQFTR
jgi:hypothetical protein